MSPPPALPDLPGQEAAGTTPDAVDQHAERDPMQDGPADPWADDPFHAEPSNAVLDRIVDAVVDRIEERVVDELERRGRHDWRVI